jgi:hypothetical protein
VILAAVLGVRGVLLTRSSTSSCLHRRRSLPRGQAPVFRLGFPAAFWLGLAGRAWGWEPEGSGQERARAAEP